jgi:Rod binding domain-containing protein
MIKPTSGSDMTAGTHLEEGAAAARPGTGINRKASDPHEIAKAASDFEGLLIGELLKSARAGGSGWLDTDSDDADSTLTEMSEQALSTSLASGGGLGLAKMVITNLQKSAVKTNDGSDGA